MFSVLLSRLLANFGLSIVAKKIYRKQFFAEEAERILAPVNEKYEQLIAHYDFKTDDRKKAEENRRIFVEMAYWLRLNEKSAIRTLDIGGRAGLFSFILKSFGHDVLTTDLPEVLESSPDKELLELFRVPNAPLKVMPFEPLVIPGEKVDLVTGFRTRFHSCDGHWGVAEWGFFLKDIANNILTDEGEMFFWLNPLEERGVGESMPKKLKELFIGGGAVVRQNYVYFSSVEKLKKKE